MYFQLVLLMFQTLIDTDIYAGGKFSFTHSPQGYRSMSDMFSFVVFAMKGTILNFLA